MELKGWGRGGSLVQKPRGLGKEWGLLWMPCQRKAVFRTQDEEGRGGKGRKRARWRSCARMGKGGVARHQRTAGLLYS